MSTAISPEVLHQGAFFALQQAGFLLRDSVLLYQSQRWASALVLSVKSIEEIGKFRVLMDNLEKALKGEVGAICTRTCQASNWNGTAVLEEIARN